MKRVILWLCLSVVIGAVQAQTGRLDLKLPQGHPRYLTTQEGKKETQELIKKAPWAKDVYERLRQRTDKYVDRGTDWLSSRLLMYWNTHATDVYIKGEYYDHAGGEKAPAPTVVFTGARSHATNYKRPRLEDLEPYQEDARGMYLANSILEGNPYEWVSISKTGRIIEMNVRMLPN